MKPELLENGKCDAVYDRGAFEAIYESDREAYVKTVLPLLTSDFRYVLNVYEYEDEVFKGPPRSCKRDEVDRLFAGHSIEGKQSIIELLGDYDFTEYGSSKYNIKGKMTKFIYAIR